jgi:hypothetical protein
MGSIFCHVMEAKRDSVTRYIFLECVNILFSGFCVCADGCRPFKCFLLLYNYYFCLLLLNYLLKFKMLTETQNSLLCDWSMFFSANVSLAAEKMRKNQLVTGSFQYDFTESQAASCKP